MRSNEGGYDYGKLARPGEVKKTQLESSPIAPVRNKTLKSAALPAEQTQGDLADKRPDNSSLVPRGRDGRNPTIPSVGQYTLEGGIVDKRQTRRGMTKPGAGDKLAKEASQNYQDSTTLASTRRQGWARTRYALAQALKRSRKGQN